MGYRDPRKQAEAERRWREANREKVREQWRRNNARHRKAKRARQWARLLLDVSRLDRFPDRCCWRIFTAQACRKRACWRQGQYRACEQHKRPGAGWVPIVRLTAGKRKRRAA